jgi:hypothetical protein
MVEQLKLTLLGGDTSAHCPTLGRAAQQVITNLRPLLGKQGLRLPAAELAAGRRKDCHAGNGNPSNYGLFRLSRIWKNAPLGLA